MHTESPKSHGREAAITIVSYDITWPAKFDEERALLQSTLGSWLAGEIEHIGSTAVPGLAAKPVIDIMAPVRTLEASRPAIEAVSALGYGYYPYMAELMHWFCKPSPSHRTHHLHLVRADSSLWQQRIAFRDALRRDPGLVTEYEQLKRRLAAAFRLDREGYTEAKSEFILGVLAGSPSAT